METTLHFLRPFWLLGFIPMLWFVWKLWQMTGKKGAWNHIIAPQFRSILLGKKSDEIFFPWAVLGLAILWSAMIVALSGPTWQKVELPAEKSNQGSVILLDLSLSMLSDDLKPNRLSRVRYKILDLLKTHPEINMGMVAYAGTAHTIAPISEDNQTLLSLTPTLTPLIMPSFGANALAGFMKANTLLQGAKVQKGHIIWITDDIEKPEIKTIAQFVKQHHLSLSILVVGTAHGGPIKVPDYGLIKKEDGQIVMAKVPFKDFYNLSQRTRANISTLDMQESDMTDLLPNTLMQVANAAEKAKSPEKTLTSWLDSGVYLLFVIVPLAAFAFRRGWAFSWLGIGLSTLLLPALMLTPSPSFAKDTQTDEDSSVTFLDVFKSPDQQGYEKWQNQDYQTAADRFEDPLWKGASLYRQGKYKEAAKQFGIEKSAQARYNQGNALAKQGDFKAAKEQYQKALQLAPDMTNAKKNLKLMDTLLASQKKQPSLSDSKKQKQSKQGKSSGNSNPDNNNPKNKSSNSDQSGQQGNQDSKAKETGTGPQNNDLKKPYQPNPKETDPDSPSGEKSEKSSDKSKKSPASSPTALQDGKTPKASSKQTDEATKLSKKSLDSDQKQGSEAPFTQQQTEAQQAQKNWLNQIPDEPGLFLKRKFEYQYQQQGSKSGKEPDKIW
ncbi:VWA domain-containing protein [Hydrogenovibrio sp. 3SP14C1]|uniref:VWA domain-containing protein n=1 Tax=Hydrogenovibrio sp. 3SP14C1 TaxID=3038774 RepID=UPI00241675FA|nr:VWA domain-containing protein [Hydrogenovibrio sp. 3SP14C1]MDG4813548.1 VWA domain-containing protein [Hydrogenovibrio sp. 3SP14C1]